MASLSSIERNQKIESRVRSELKLDSQRSRSTSKGGVAPGNKSLEVLLKTSSKKKSVEKYNLHLQTEAQSQKQLGFQNEDTLASS